MPDLRFGAAIRQTLVEKLSTGQTGTIHYDIGSLIGPNLGTIVGGVVFQTQKIHQLENAEVLEGPHDEGTIMAAVVLGVGLQMGTIYGTNIGTVVPAPNNVLVRILHPIAVTATVVADDVVPINQMGLKTILGTVTIRASGI